MLSQHKYSRRTCIGRLALSAAGLFVPRIYSQIGPSPPYFNARFRSSLRDVASYWKLDENSGTRVDSVSTRNLAQTGNHIDAIAGVINQAAATAGGLTDLTAVLSCPDDAVIGIGAGISFTFTFWFKFTSKAFNTPLIAKWYDANHADYLLQIDNADTTGFNWNVNNSIPGFGGTAFINKTIPNDTNFHFACCGFDNANQQIFFSIDNGGRSTVAQTLCVRTTAPFGMFNQTNVGVSNQNASSLGLDECGFWRRVLTSTEETTLYNGGAGYALSNFYP